MIGASAAVVLRGRSDVCPSGSLAADGPIWRNVGSTGAADLVMI
jgi:hypothetical protein